MFLNKKIIIRSFFIILLITIFLSISHQNHVTKVYILNILNNFLEKINLRLYKNPSVDYDSLSKSKTTIYEESLIEKKSYDSDIYKNFFHNTGRNSQDIIGYTDKFSYQLGDDIILSFSGDILSKSHWLSSFKIFDALHGIFIFQKEFHPHEKEITKQACQSYHKGCFFEKNLKISTNNIGIGEFFLQLYNEHGHPSEKIYFSVRPSNHSMNQLNSYDMAIMFPNHTWQAYNSAGGGCLYGHEPKNINILGTQIPKDNLFAVSLLRPLLYTNNLVEDTLIFIKKIKEKNLSYFSISNTDLHENPSLLSSCKVLLIGGHDEYWTLNMRKAVENFVRNGGYIINFSGNVCWWNANLINKTLFVDKNYFFLKRPQHYPSYFLGTGLFEKTDYPVEKFFGYSYQFAGYPIKRILLEKIKSKNSQLIDQDIIEKSQSIEILDEKHPIFNNLNLRKGSFWGKSSHLIDVEVDGIPLDENDQIEKKFIKYYKVPDKIKVLGKTYSWSNLYCLGFGSRKEIQKIGIVLEVEPFNNPKSGKIINVGTIGFSASLAKKDPITVSVFNNTLDYLLR